MKREKEKQKSEEKEQKSERGKESKKNTANEQKPIYFLSYILPSFALCVLFFFAPVKHSRLFFISFLFGFSISVRVFVGFAFRFSFRSK